MIFGNIDFANALRALESGTVVVEMKDGAYEPMKEGDVRLGKVVILPVLFVSSKY